MKYLLVAFIISFCFVSSSLAYELLESEVDKPYNLVSILGDIESGKVYLGVLDNFPALYETVVTSTSTLVVSLRQLSQGLNDPTPFSLIMVKHEDSGEVTEIARFSPRSESWNKGKDSSLGLTFLDTEEVRQVLTPGTYRIEVSTPSNMGRYMLVLGEYTEKPGYFEQLRQARQIQGFMGFSVFKMMTSSLVYYPLGIIFLLFILGATRKYRRLISHVD